jgi:hypothetical protein
MGIIMETKVRISLPSWRDNHIILLYWVKREISQSFTCGSIKFGSKRESLFLPNTVNGLSVLLSPLFRE